MKITLIYPGIAGLGFNSIGKWMDAIWINLGLCYIGAYLKQQGYSVGLIDLRRIKNWDDFSTRLNQENSDMVGVQFNTVNFDYAMQCCKIAKEYNKIVVAGGPHAIFSPQQLLNSGFIDYVICGEGEISFLELIQHTETDITSNRIIPGKRMDNLDTLPFPDRELFGVSDLILPRYFSNFPHPDNGLVIMASRGCVYNCTFCQPLVKQMFGDKVRYRSVENVIYELKFLIDKYKIKYISFQDDTFTARKSWVFEFCNKIKEEKININWSAQSRVNTVDEELIKEMKDAGCTCLVFGFESGSQRILDFIKKGINVEQSISAAKLCKKYGIIMFADYMIGIPTETKEDLKQTYKMIKEIKPEIHSLTYFTPVPGSYLYEYCKENNLINITTFSDFDRRPTGEKIKGVNYKLLNRWKQKMLKQSPKWYNERYYAKLAIKRWLYLLRKKMFFQVISEFIIRTFLQNSSILEFGKSIMKKIIYRKT